MIDIENELYTAVYDAVAVKYPDITPSGVYIPVPSAFPFYSFEEADNYTDKRTLDSSGVENHAKLMYETYVYSKHATAKKAECKAILAIIDDTMSKKGFIRKTRPSIPMEDKSIYCLFARYEATVSRNKTII